MRRHPMKTILRNTTSTLVSAALLLSATGAMAADGIIETQAYCIPEGTTAEGGFKPSDNIGVDSAKGTLKLMGSATITNDGRLDLTSDKVEGSQKGNVYYTSSLDFEYVTEAESETKPFHTFFSFSIGSTKVVDDRGGLAFLIQNNSLDKDGSNLDALGYGGILPSMAIEFDTWKDTPPGGASSYIDPVNDHIGFMLDGNHYDHPAWYLPMIDNKPVSFSSTDYTRYYVWVDYNGGASRQLDLYFSTSEKKPSTPIKWEIHEDIDLKSQTFPDAFDPAYWLSVDDGGKLAKGWVGFSATAYNAKDNNRHSIHEWEFSNEGIPCACQGESACAGADETPACSRGDGTLGTGICVECTVLQQQKCDVKGWVCDPKNERCVECNVNADCEGRSPVCDTEKHACKPCETNLDCNGDPEKPECVLVGDVAGSCQPDCDEGTARDAKTGACVPDPALCAANGACQPEYEEDVQGGGFACSASGSPESDGLGAVFGAALGAAAIARRRRSAAAKR
jgi:hypothetical protein